MQDTLCSQPGVQVDAYGSLHDERDHPVEPRDVGGGWIAKPSRNTKVVKAAK